MAIVGVLWIGMVRVYGLLWLGCIDFYSERVIDLYGEVVMD